MRSSPLLSLVFCGARGYPFCVLSPVMTPARQVDQQNSDALSSEGAQTMGALETVRAFNEAVNAQQWDRVAGYLTEDFIFSGVTPQPVGKQGFIEGQNSLGCWGAKLACGAARTCVRRRAWPRPTPGSPARTRASSRLPAMPSMPPTGKSFATPITWSRPCSDHRLIAVEPGPPDHGLASNDPPPLPFCIRRIQLRGGHCSPDPAERVSLAVVSPSVERDFRHALAQAQKRDEVT